MIQASPSWVALQVAEQLRAIERIATDAVRACEALDPDAAVVSEPRISSGEIGELKLLCESLAELTARTDQLAGQLPDDALDVDGDDVAGAAAADLAAGIIDPARVQLAARVLPSNAGWHALSQGLRSTDTHASWDDVSIGELLGAFRGATEQDVQQVLESADVSGTLEFATCDPATLQRLAAALEEHTSAQ